jgi:hypothetical protein
MVARNARHNVPSKKAIASVLSFISISFWTDLLLISMNNFGIYAFLNGVVKSRIVFLCMILKSMFCQKYGSEKRWVEIEMEVAFLQRPHN